MAEAEYSETQQDTQPEEEATPNDQTAEVQQFDSETPKTESNPWSLFIAITGGFTNGYPTSIIAGIIGEDHWKTHTDNEISFLVTSIVIGLAVGAFICGTITEHFGRKRPHFVFSILIVIASLVMAFMKNLWALSAVRIIQGLGIGVTSAIAPTYTSELASDKWRGRFVTMYQVSLIGGIVVARGLNMPFNYVDDGWQYEFGLCAVSPLIIACCILFAPESPAYVEQLKKKAAGETQEEGQLSFKEVIQEYFRYPRSVIVTIILAFNLQMTGVNAISSYAPIIIRYTGLSDRLYILLVSFLITVWDWIAVFCAIFSVRAYGPRTLLCIGSFITTIGLLFVCIGFMTASDDLENQDDPEASVLVLSILGISVFLFGFQFGVSPTYYVLITDLFPDTVRGFGTSVAMVVCWVCNIIVVEIYLPLVNGIGQGPVFIIFTAISLFSFFFALFVVRTTKSLRNAQQ